MNLRLIDKSHEAGDVTTFVFEPEQPLTWRAGQYLHYTLDHLDKDDRGDERWFTISSAPFEELVGITTRLVPDRRSSFKAALARLPIGATITADPPEGDFVAGDAHRQYILLAGGIGITPFRSILRQLDHDGRTIRARLLYAHRDDTEPVFAQELNELAQRHNGFTVQYFAYPHRIETGDILAAAMTLPDPYFYISGPEPMVEHYEATLKELGIPTDRIKTDFFPGYEGI